MLVLLITNSISHFFDDANVLATDILMLRRSTDDLSNISDVDGNTPDKVVIDGEIWFNNDAIIDMARKLKEDALILLRYKEHSVWCTKYSFIKSSEITFKYIRKQMEECSE